MICDRPDLTLQAVLADQLRRVRHALMFIISWLPVTQEQSEERRVPTRRRHIRRCSRHQGMARWALQRRAFVRSRNVSYAPALRRALHFRPEL